MSEARQGLTRDDWLEAGLEVLAEDGHASLRIAVLTRRLGVTKGSFYWHFENVDEFHGALLQYWHKRRIKPAVGDAKRGADFPAERLRELLVERGMPRYDIAIREWAKTNPKAAKAIEESERFRRQFFADMLIRQGIDPDRAAVLAQLVIWAWRGSADEPNLRWRGKVMAALFEAIQD